MNVAATGSLADPVSHAEIDRILAGTHHDPHSVLGAHPAGSGMFIRALRPLAGSVTAVLEGGRRLPMSHVYEGVFSVLVPQAGVPDYRIAVSYPGTAGETIGDDPYRHAPTLGELDLHLMAEGRHEELWRVLGARVLEAKGLDAPALDARALDARGVEARGVEARGVEARAREPEAGTAFAVWAPNARGVRVVGDFNHWDGRGHPMRSLGGSGVWELMIPGLGAGQRYKYEIRGRDGSWRLKADPMAALAEQAPATASVIYASHYEWADQDWVDSRSAASPLAGPMSVYEVHLGSWRPGLSYRDLADALAGYVGECGFTHVEFMPLAEHPFAGSWGYQVTSYYAPTSRFGTPDDFRYLVDRLHQAGIGVILDWVPAHFPRDDWALARFDGSALYENPDPRRGVQPDWGTLIFDYGRNEVRNFLVANAVYWLKEFHVDGLRVDAVASMLYLDYSRKAGEWSPNALGGRENLDAVAFLQEVNSVCYRQVPGTMIIAEESTSWPGVTRPVYLGGLGFGFKWNMGWMHDTLDYLARDPVHRSYHHSEMTFSMMYAYSENFVLPLSHDEVVHGKRSLLRKMPGDEWRQFAGLRSLLAYMWAHPGKKLIFMGSEFGQPGEWSEQGGLDWQLLGQERHAGVLRLVGDLNRAYTRNPAMWQLDSDPAGFGWIDANDSAGNVLSFLRFAAPAASPANPVACIANFSGEPHENYRIGLPQPGRWAELLNTDAQIYGGSGVGNLGAVEAVPQPQHGLPASAVLRLPPMGVLWLTPDA